MGGAKRWSLSVPIEGVSLSEHAEIARELEQLGYRDAWSYETPCGSEGCSRLQPASNRRPVADNVFAHARSPRPLVARAFGPANGRPGSPEGLRYD